MSSLDKLSMYRCAKMFANGESFVECLEFSCLPPLPLEEPKAK
jgi:hypothetical protein